MVSYPPLIDFEIDLTDSVPQDYWNFYSFDSSIISSLDYDYLKILKNQGFLTEIMPKDPVRESIMLLSVTEDRRPCYEKSRNRRIKGKLELLKRVYRDRGKKKEKIEKIQINFKLIRKKTKYYRHSLLAYRRCGFNPGPKIHKVVIKLEESAIIPHPQLETQRPPVLPSFPQKNTIKPINFTANYPHFNPVRRTFPGQKSAFNFTESESPTYSSKNGFHTKENGFMIGNNTFPPSEKEASFKPTFKNFVAFLQAMIPFKRNHPQFCDIDLESLYLLRALVDLHEQPNRTPTSEKTKTIIKNLPLLPQEPHCLPVINHAFDIDSSLLHLNVETDLTGLQFLSKNTSRIVTFNEEKSLSSLATHFKMPMEDLGSLFNSVSRHFPDLLEVFKGNNRVVWNEEEDVLLKNGQCLGKDRKRMLRRIKYLGSIDSNFFK